MRYALLCTTVTLLLAVPACAQDADGDRIPDAIEETLATDPEFAEELELIAESPVKETLTGDQARFDLRKVYFGNVARGRWLWRIEFAIPYSFDNTSIIVYVDADNNPATGREGMGCEVTYGHSGGNPGQMFYLPNERLAEFPPPRVAVADGALYICADFPLNQQDGRSVFRMSILSEQRDPHESRDSLGWQNISGPGDSDRERVRTLADLPENEGFLDTQSAALLWEIQADERNVILNSFHDAQYEGFAYYESEYRWPALRRTSGGNSITVEVPRAGRFFPALVVYDAIGPEGWEMRIAGERVGRFPLSEDNRRQRLFFLPEAIQFRGGETIELRAASTGGPHIIEDIVLLAERPPVMRPPREISNLEVTWDWERACHRATWTTTWPVACTVSVGNEQITEEQPVQNHRVYLPELPAGELECSILARNDRDDVDVTAATRFASSAPEPPRGSVARERLELTVSPPRQGQPLTAGVPFARGVLGSTDHLLMLDPDGREMPLQARALVRWPDGSIKVALLDTHAAETPQAASLVLEYGYGVQRSAVDDPVEVIATEAGIEVDTGALRATFDPKASGMFTSLRLDSVEHLDPTRPLRIVLTDEAGNAYDTLSAPDSLVVEEAGPMRAVIRADGHHTGDAGELFTYQIRFTFRRAAPTVGISYRWGNDRSAEEFTRFRGIRMEVPLAMNPEARVTVGSEEPITGTLADGLRLQQLRDDSYTVGEQTGRRAAGWIAVEGEPAFALLRCRDFWQLYPKAIGAADGMLYLDICPEFGATEYNDCDELDLIKLYYYLQDGVYKVRQGVTKVHDTLLWLGDGFRGEITPEVAAFIGEVFNTPPVLAASPDYYAACGVFGDFVPRTAGRTARYDAVVEKSLNAYLAYRERNRNYGMLNYGDQFGERKVNYSNGEYDHHHTAAQMFLRTGDPRWHYLMQDMARHDIDVDLCHYHTNPGYRGGSWTHAMGHTGGYFTQRYQGEFGSPSSGMSPTHTWCEGTCEYYMLTGDPTAIEAARSIADRYSGAFLNNYDFNIGREPGWQLILTMAVYRTTYDPFYLNACRLMVERTLERRTPGGGWDRQMVPGHCFCQPRCYGLCSFMQGIQGIGLREYWRETGDERIPPAVVDSARHMIDELWVEEKGGFRYTSCPQTTVTSSQADTVGGIMLFAWEHSKDEAILSPTLRALEPCLDSLSSLAHLRWTPYIIYALDRIDQEATAAGRPSPTRDLLRRTQAQAPPAQFPPPELSGRKTIIGVQAEDFSAQGGGQVNVVERIGNVGKMITMWHAELGHWLEWKVAIPAQGNYTIWARYATDCETSHRSLTIDGDSPGAGYDHIAFTRTGGYCTETDNWKLIRLGEPIALTAGEHTIRMTNLAEGLALDYLAVVGEQGAGNGER